MLCQTAYSKYCVLFIIDIIIIYQVCCVVMILLVVYAIIDNLSFVVLCNHHMLFPCAYDHN